MESNGKPGEDYTVEKALQLFPYFDTWSRTTITACCRLSRIKIIPPDGIIIDSEDQESAGVHFIMEGTCKLIEHLSLVPKKRGKNGINYSIFHDNNIGHQMSGGDEPRYSSLLFNTDRTVCLENESEKPVETPEGKTEEGHVEREEVHVVGSEEGEVAVADGEDEETTENKYLPKEKEEKDEPSELKKPREFFQFYRRMLPYISAKNRIVPETSTKVESHFLQIALVHKGCCLGLGENLRNRYLVSVTKVTCLVIPLQFLLQHNPNNIWNRIKQFLNDYLPKEEKVLSEFIINKKWNECKREFVASKGVKSSSKMSDVPLSVRLNDANMRVDTFQRIFLQPP